MATLLAPIPLDDKLAGADDDQDFVSDDDGESSTRLKKPLRSRKHDRLIKSIARLDTTRTSLRKIERTEAAAKIGDQHVSGASLRSVSVSALLKTSDGSAADVKLRKKLAKKTSSSVLPEPLKRHEAVKVQRALAYEEVSKDLGKWDKIVKINRSAEGVSFPLDQTKLQVQTTSEYVKRYQTRTPLEQQIEELVGSSKNNLTSSTILTEAEREALQAMSIEEAEQRRHELQKHRALLSYREQKARWQSKIKSKSYHRHLRRAKRKIDEKDFEELKVNDPEAAAEKLERIDRNRLQERLTLKHRGVGKWARRMAGKARTDKNAREALQEQLRLSRSIAEKISPMDTTEELVPDEKPEICDEFTDRLLNEEAASNPWMSSTLGFSWEEPTMDEVFENLESVESGKKKKKTNATSKPAENVVPEVYSRNRNNKRKVVDEPEEEEAVLVDGGEMVHDSRNVSAVVAKGVSAQHWRNVAMDTDVDPSNVLLATRTKVRKTVVPNNFDFNEEQNEPDSDDEQRGIIAEAFADDDVVGDFVKHKKQLEEEEKPKDIDLSLPGWGDWTGAGIGPNLAKKRKFTVKAPKGRARRDKLLTNVVISEKHDEKIVPHQVKELPFPFTTVSQFHSSIRMPIGKMWNTEAAFDEMTKPKYTTKMGTVIKPINVKTVLKRHKRKKGEGFADNEDNELGKTVVDVAKKVRMQGAQAAKKKKSKL